MRPGPQAVVRTLAKRVILLLLALAALAAVGDPRGAALLGGLLALAALAVHAIAFGVAASLRAAPPQALRMAAAAGVLVAAGAGVWASHGAAFRFIVARVDDLAIAPGGALMQAAAFLAVLGAGAFVFLCIAGRATALGDGR